MTDPKTKKSAFDRLPEPYRSRAIADRHSSELEGIPCSEEEAVQATERYLAAGEPERIRRITKLAEQAEKEGRNFYEAFLEEERKTRPYQK